MVPRRDFVMGALATAASTLVPALVLAQGNELRSPPALQPAFHALYRLTFWLTAPAQRLLLLVLPLTDHDVPARVSALAALLTSPAGWVGWVLASRFLAAPLVDRPPDTGRRRVMQRLGAALAANGGVGTLGAGL